VIHHTIFDGWMGLADKILQLKRKYQASQVLENMHIPLLIMFLRF
jgi:hypothetical protein